MDWQTIKADLAAQDPNISLEQKVAAINLLTITSTNQPFTLGQAKAIARTSATADWSLIVGLSRGTPRVPPTTPQDYAILAAINVTEGLDSDVIDPNNTAVWLAFTNGLAALGAVGALSTASSTAILGLATQTVPKYIPALTTGIAQTAEVQ